MMLRLQKYDLTVRHKLGKEIPVPEMLSCLHLKEIDDTHEVFDATWTIFCIFGSHLLQSHWIICPEKANT